MKKSASQKLNDRLNKLDPERAKRHAEIAALAAKYAEEKRKQQQPKTIEESVAVGDKVSFLHPTKKVRFNGVVHEVLPDLVRVKYKEENGDTVIANGVSHNQIKSLKETISTVAADETAVFYTKPDGSTGVKRKLRSTADIIKEAVAEAIAIKNHRP